jgi:membrane fusion protein (multidrug efflux system)
MILRLIIVVVLLAAVFGAIFGWKYYVGEQMAAAQSGGPPPATVAVSEAHIDRWQPYLHSVGSLVAVAGIEVTNEVAGKISAIRFESGQEVAAGDLLLQLDDQSDRAQLRGLQAEERLARLRFQRTARLLKQNSASQSDYDEALATLDGAKAAVAAQEALIDKKQIQAPFEGQLGIRRVDLGEFLAPGSAIVPLEALDPIYVDFSLPERELARVRVGQSLEVSVQAFPGRTFTGEVSAIDPGVEVATRSLRLRATLDNPDRLLRPGMFSSVKVLLGGDEEVLTIPRTAVTYNPYGDSVFVVFDRDGQLVVQRRQVQTGEARGGRVEVISGLEPGDRVVSAGQVKLRNGQPIVVDDKPAPAERESSS